MRLPLALVAALGLASCGASPGGSCDSPGYFCADNKNAQQCQFGTWVLLPCRGTAGCQHTGNNVTCDMSQDVEGDACATVVLGTGMCSADGKTTLECRNGPNSGAPTLVKTNTCSSCSATGSEILCQP